eukprot:124850-Chlamydomonas_euryale.AAC.1
MCLGLATLQVPKEKGGAGERGSIGPLPRNLAPPQSTVPHPTYTAACSCGTSRNLAGAVERRGTLPLHTSTIHT